MIMSREDASKKVQNIFTTHFNIAPDHFDWEKPLESIHEDFKILSYLVFLEQLIQDDFDIDIPIIENISTSFHTPNDILSLIVNEL